MIIWLKVYQDRTDSKAFYIVNALYVEEFLKIIESKALHTFEPGLHTKFIGEIINKGKKTGSDLLAFFR